jgi:hypothetical protein
MANGPDWVPDEALAALQCERMVAPDKTHEELARDILMTAAPMAASSVAHLSVYAANENVRLSAAKYIIDGVVGGGFKAQGGQDDMLLALVSKLSENDPVYSQAANQPDNFTTG